MFCVAKKVDGNRLERFFHRSAPAGSRQRACEHNSVLILGANMTSVLPPPTRDSVYDLIFRNLWSRGPDSGTENGHTWLYRPHATLARRCTVESRPQLEAMRNEFLVLYNIGDMPAIIPSADTSPEQCADLLEIMFERSKASTVIFEGYAMNSADEGRPLDWQLVRKATRMGKRAIYAGGPVCDVWNNKHAFRQRVMAIHGVHAVTPGIQFENPSAESVSRWVTEMFGKNETQVVIKVNGCAGMGNLILTRGQPNILEAISHFLRSAPKSLWVIGEVWRKWEKSCCVSFFAPDDVTLPVHMTVCGQVLTKAGGFIGGKSFDTISPRDQTALGAIVSPVALAMRNYGMRGFMGFDVILCIPRKGDRNILPDCGLAVVFIETNARLNGHNQEMLALDLLARRDGTKRDALIHMRVCNKAVTDAEDRAASWRFFTDRLRGIAKPLTSQKIVEGEAYFLLDVNHGSTPSPHDAVMFLGTEEAAPRIMQAFESLNAEGLLRT